MNSCLSETFLSTYTSQTSKAYQSTPSSQSFLILFNLPILANQVNVINLKIWTDSLVVQANFDSIACDIL